MNNPPIIYLFLYKVIKQKANGRIIVAHNEVIEILKRRIWKISHKYYFPIIKEMCQFRLLKRINKRKYEIIGGNIDNLLNRLSIPI